MPDTMLFAIAAAAVLAIFAVVIWALRRPPMPPVVEFGQVRLSEGDLRKQIRRFLVEVRTTHRQRHGCLDNEEVVTYLLYVFDRVRLDPCEEPGKRIFQHVMTRCETCRSLTDGIEQRILAGLSSRTAKA